VLLLPLSKELYLALNISFKNKKNFFILLHFDLY
jgi:hypothetical protein